LTKQDKTEFKYEVDEYWFKFSNFMQLIFGGACIAYAKWQANEDSTSFRAFEFSKTEDPFMFWFCIIFIISTGCLSIYLGLIPFLHWCKNWLSNKRLNSDND